MEKFSELHPNFKEEYSQEIKEYANKTLHFNILGEWLNCRPENARKKILKSKLNDTFGYALYVLTFLPPSIFFSLNKLRYKIRSIIG
ncbi:MAG: hypothetical protein HOG63_03895 [Nitrospina sp.]|nr:hypothetical protein [Nitrospina sp.]